VFSDVRVHSFCEIKDSVILPEVTIGRNVKLNRVVIDKGAEIPEGMEIGFNPEEDKKRFYVTDKGITLVTPAMLGKPTHRIR
jgi:glucose-1-phosphate adenylyltransferase